MTRATRRRALLAAALGASATTPFARADDSVKEPDMLARIRSLGALKVAVYREFYPYFDDGTGIDADLAAALAKSLGVKATLLPFEAGDNLDDDLRNMVWRGHYLGYGPADVMLHVPIDRALMERNDRVRIFAPYFRETIRVARDISKIPTWSWDALPPNKIAVDASSLSALVLLGYQSGRYAQHMINAKDAPTAIQALKSGAAAAMMGTRAELEAGLHGDERFAIEDAQIPGIPPGGWIVGLAVKSGQEPLARALQDAMNRMQDGGELARLFAAHGVKYSRP